MKSYLRTKDYSVSQEEFELLYDPEMEMLVTRPIPENLDEYYQSEDYISHTDSRKSLVDKVYQTVKKFSFYSKLRLIDKFGGEERRLLDMGAGTGDFLLAAKSSGWKISGIEPNHDARMRAREKRVELLSEMELLRNQQFDVITLWHVLEHLPDLENQILKLLEVLEPNGTLVIAVPNFNSYDAKYYKEFWAAFDVPRHLWHFSRTSIEKLFLKHGLNVVQVKPLIFDSFYVSLLSEKYKTGRQNFAKALWIGLRSNIAAWRSKEYSSHIYILQRAQ
ncbi:class I SAM-dependent methyltransferase [Maribacter algicola]|uniref:Class I SAM-dependent methyltransferase n=1 Tax=Meishania litoralis TaxID=3434685 RepID=A0ACC7LNE9_9FLAO